MGLSRSILCPLHPSPSLLCAPGGCLGELPTRLPFSGFWLGLASGSLGGREGGQGISPSWWSWVGRIPSGPQPSRRAGLPAPGSRTCSLLQSHTGKVSTTTRCLIKVISPQPHPHAFLLLVPTDSSHFPTLRVPYVVCWGGCEFLRTAVTNYHQLVDLEEQNFILSKLSSPGVQQPSASCWQGQALLEGSSGDSVLDISLNFWCCQPASLGIVGLSCSCLTPVSAFFMTLCLCIPSLPRKTPVGTSLVVHWLRLCSQDREPGFDCCSGN